MQLEVKGPCPGVRAGHAVVDVGSKASQRQSDSQLVKIASLHSVAIFSQVYVIGGVGDKRYYGDVWVLHVEDAAWCQLDVRGRLPQGRFSHTANADGSDVVIYGG